MVPFAPRLIPVILPNLAHHVGGIQTAALQTNRNLFSVIESLPSPPPLQIQTQSQPAQANHTGSSTSSVRVAPASPPVGDGQLLPFPRTAPQPPDNKQPDASTPTPTRTQIPLPKSVRDRTAPSASPEAAPDVAISRPHSPTANLIVPKSAPVSGVGGGTHAPVAPQRQDTITTSNVANLTSLWQNPSHTQPQTQNAPVQDGQAPTAPTYVTFSPEEAEADPFDYQATVSGLMVQFLSEYVETRVAALKWLLMLHHKAPKKVTPAYTSSVAQETKQTLQILTMDGEDGTFPVLLKTLSDPSDEVQRLKPSHQLSIHVLNFPRSSDAIFNCLPKSLRAQMTLTSRHF